MFSLLAMEHAKLLKVSCRKPANIRKLFKLYPKTRIFDTCVLTMLDLFIYADQWLIGNLNQNNEHVFGGDLQHFSFVIIPRTKALFSKKQ